MALSLRTIFGRRATTKRKAPRVKKGLRFEALESRLALSTLTVGTDPKDDFSTIQAAVTAAKAGDTIKVDPGTYTEQVTINNVGHSRDNVRIVGSDQRSVIQAPAVLAADATHGKFIVDVDGSKNVRIEKLTIAGPGGGGCDSIEYGVRVDGGGSANITDNHITNIRDNPFSGCQNGNAIQVGRNAQGQTGSAVISHNTIDNYQKTGIVVDAAGSSAQIDHNTIVGVGPTAVIAQNGIQISRGATAQVDHNDISGNVYSPQTDASTGILLFQAGAVSVDHNTLSSNDVGIYVSEGGAGIVISDNNVSGSTFDGIALEAVSGAVVDHNTISNNGDGIGLYSSLPPNSVPSTNNTISHNSINNNSGPGIYVETGSTGNTFSDNKMKGNTPDAQDDSTGGGTAGTGNTWRKNKGKTSSPAGLVS